MTALQDADVLQIRPERLASRNRILKIEFGTSILSFSESFFIIFRKKQATLSLYSGNVRFLSEMFDMYKSRLGFAFAINSERNRNPL